MNGWHHRHHASISMSSWTTTTLIQTIMMMMWMACVKAWNSPPQQHHHQQQHIRARWRPQHCNPVVAAVQRHRHLYRQPTFLSNSESSNERGDGVGEETDPILRLPLLEAELATLRSSNDDDDAVIAELSEKISNAKTAAEFGVRKAQLIFYDAFSTGDLEAMGRVWSTESHVRCVHPGMESFEGRDAVMESWKSILAVNSGGDSDNSGFTIQPDRAQVEIHGLIAICSCIEKSSSVSDLGGGGLEALNIYKREAGSWRMTLHMANPIVVKRLS